LSAAIRGDRHENVPQHLERLSEALDVRPRAEGRDYGLMDWRQVRELVAQGHDIGGHTATHCNVVGLDPETLRREVVSSLATIEDRVGSPVLSFAYPYGHFDRVHNQTAEALAQTGCRVAFTGAVGVVQGRANPCELPRTHLNRRFLFACAYNVQNSLNRTARPSETVEELHEPFRQH
jgi:hypothetical protein